MLTDLPKPLLKWAGGKRQLLDAIVQRLPAEPIPAYHEPFVGGGALFFWLHRHEKYGRAIISDLNHELITTYRAVRDHVEDVITLLSNYEHDQLFYYGLRAKDPAHMSPPEVAARMIFLNKTGFNGLYRVNQSGKFNVPFGRYKNPNFCDEPNLHAVSNALDEVEICHGRFSQVLDRAQAGDFVYFDPPYAPVSDTADFTGYLADGFDAHDQAELRDVCLRLHENGVRFMVSNSAVQAIDDLYAAPVFHLHRVYANRSINSKGGRRGPVPEYLITNYETAVGDEPAPT